MSPERIKHALALADELADELVFIEQALTRCVMQVGDLRALLMLDLKKPGKPRAVPKRGKTPNALKGRP